MLIIVILIPGPTMLQFPPYLSLVLMLALSSQAVFFPSVVHFVTFCCKMGHNVLGISKYALSVRLVCVAGS